MIDEELMAMLHRTHETMVADLDATIDVEAALRDLYQRARVAPPPPAES